MKINHEQGIHIGNHQGAEPMQKYKPSMVEQMEKAIQKVTMVNGVSDSMIDEAIKDAKAIEFPGMKVMAICVELKNGMYVTEFSHPNDDEEYDLEKEFEKAKKEAKEKIRVLLEYHNKEMITNYPHILKEKEKAPWDN